MPAGRVDTQKSNQDVSASFKCEVCLCMWGGLHGSLFLLLARLPHVQDAACVLTLVSNSSGWLTALYLCLQEHDLRTFDLQGRKGLWGPRDRDA